ncbi:MAG: hypothetical protein KC468_29050 [Myxococcales bacterium]|nr:hypothetical protein [Myxococcales bacterium]
MRAIEYQRYGPLEVLSPGGAADAGPGTASGLPRRGRPRSRVDADRRVSGACYRDGADAKTVASSVCTGAAYRTICI